MQRENEFLIAFIIRVLMAVTIFLLPGWAFANPINEITQGTLVAKDLKTGLHAELPRLSTDVEINVTGLIARAHVTQRFSNPSDQWTEALFAFPLPENAAVDTLHMVIGGRTVVGKIKEKDEARKTYEAAKASGQRTALVEQHRPNIFSAAVANIPPNGEIEVRIEYQHQLEWKDNRFSIRFPMAITPRYVPKRKLPPTKIVHSKQSLTGGWQILPGELPQDIKTSDETEDPLNTQNLVRLAINLEAGFPMEGIRSFYHPIKEIKANGVVRIELVEGHTPANRDFVLEWQNAQKTKPTAAFFSEATDQGDFGLLMVLPPQIQPEVIPPRELTFIIDTSGSMGGQSIIQAKSALLEGLSDLRPYDTFNVVAFESSARRLFTMTKPATDKALKIAKQWVQSLKADGGTEVMPAFMEAIEGSTDPTSRLRQIVFLTDGAVGNEQEVFQFIRDNLGNQRLFMVGIGSAPNSHFMAEAAHFGRGTFTHIGDVNEISAKVKILFDQLKRPVLTDLKLTAKGLTELTPAIVPDLYAGEPVVIAMKLQKGGRRLAINGRLGSTEWQQHLGIQKDVPQSGLRINWARGQIKQLMRSRITGRPPHEIKREVTALALQHHLVSPFTSLVAVDVTPARLSSSDLSQKILNSERVAGMAARSIRMAQTALGIEWRLLGGLILIILGSLLWITTRRMSEQAL